jgi:hypothetical protein
MIRMAIQVVFPTTQTTDGMFARSSGSTVVSYVRQCLGCPWLKPGRSPAAFSRLSSASRSQSGKRISAPAPTVAIGAR